MFLSPVTLSGSAVFKDIKELKPAQCVVISEREIKVREYWRLTAKPWSGDAKTAANDVGELITDAVRRQTVSDVPLCTFLSGGLDSSVLTALAAEIYRKKGKTLSTYSFEYEGNRENFRQSLFQPQGDDEFARYLAKWLMTDHTVLTAPNEAVADCLLSAVDARDFPLHSRL